MSAALLEARGMVKTYGAVTALRGVDFRISRGEIVALVGDNGAGKSTFIKILAGAVAPSAGLLLHKGRKVTLDSTDDAHELGIETVYQDLGLCPNLTVAENLFLGREKTRGIGPLRFLDKRAMRQATEEVLPTLTVNVPPADAGVAQLSGGQRQAVALARAKLWERELLLLDEPTAALGVQESRRAIDAVRRLQEADVAIVIVSHNLPLVLELAHRIVVLRHGMKVGDVRRDAVTGDDIVALITGARESWIEAA